MSVLSAGYGVAVDLDDVSMQRPGAYSKTRAVGVNSMANDFMVEVGNE